MKKMFASGLSLCLSLLALSASDAPAAVSDASQFECADTGTYEWCFNEPGEDGRQWVHQQGITLCREGLDEWLCDASWYVEAGGSECGTEWKLVCEVCEIGAQGCGYTEG